MNSKGKQCFLYVYGAINYYKDNNNKELLKDNYKNFEFYSISLLFTNQFHYSYLFFNNSMFLWIIQNFLQLN